DFAYFVEKAPGTMFRLGIGGEVPMLTHNPGFNFADESLPMGIAVLAKYVVNALNPKGK
ncbi:MAG: amidohydrolase, partial [Synergistaceae bacterium]|nr:amidohydrolase [Synergistaceae bacterium]